MILANPCSCCCKDLQHRKSAQNLPETCPGDCVKNLPEADLYRQARWKLIWADLWAAVAGRCWADVSACKSATQRLQIGDPVFANLRFATPKIRPKSARNLPRRLVKYLSGADLYRQARWKLIWADLWAAVAGRFRADVGQMFGFANRRPNVCKSATQCLHIGDPY